MYRVFVGLAVSAALASFLAVGVTLPAVLDSVPLPGCCKPKAGCCDPTRAGLLKPCPCGESPAGLYDEVFKPYCEIRVGPDPKEPTSRGSGAVVAVGGRKLILTASHLFGQLKPAQPFPPVHYRRYVDGKAVDRPAKVVSYSDPESGQDLALLDPGPAGADLPAARWRPGVRPELGRRVYYTGTPLGLHGWTCSTEVAIPVVNRGGREYFCINGQGTYGVSGSPVYVKDFDGHYWVCGVVVRFAWGDSRSAILCNSPLELERFLLGYLNSLHAMPRSVG